jgi:hypothetical protein
MTRCNSCNGVIKKMDLECYTCGDRVPGASKPFGRRTRDSKQPPPVTPLSNLLFMASLLLTGVSFLFSERISLPIALSLSGILLAARVLTDRRAAPRVAKVPRSARPVEISPALLRRVTLS